MKNKPIKKLIRGATYFINYPGHSSYDSYVGNARCISDLPDNEGWFEFKLLEARSGDTVGFFALEDVVAKL